MIGRLLRELRAVGPRDWLWFTVWLRRDEFHPRLRIFRYWKPGEPLLAALARLRADRQRAHAIDETLRAL